MREGVKKTACKFLKALGRGMTVVVVLLGLTPAAGATVPSRASVPDRIDRIRLVLRERLQSPVVPEPEQGKGPLLAQWGNYWTNLWNDWANWDNGRDWNNWADWGNWGNWGNYWSNL